MSGYDQLLKKVRKFNMDRILLGVWRNPSVQRFIIELNTEGQPTSQLLQKGEDSLGVTLGEYSPFTKQIKVEKGQRIDHITLKDTGDFYETFFVRPFLKGFEIKANGDKGGGDNLFDDFGEDITGLNEENKLILCEFIRPFFIAEATRLLSQVS